MYFVEISNFQIQWPPSPSALRCVLVGNDLALEDLAHNLVGDDSPHLVELRVAEAQPARALLAARLVELSVAEARPARALLAARLVELRVAEAQPARALLAVLHSPTQLSFVFDVTSHSVSVCGRLTLLWRTAVVQATKRSALNHPGGS